MTMIYDYFYYYYYDYYSLVITITSYINYDSIFSILYYIHSIMLYTAHNIHTLKRLIFGNISFREINLRKDLFSLMKIMYFTFANKVNVNNFGLIYFKYWYWFFD